jgi:hypothetical protein
MSSRRSNVCALFRVNVVDVTLVKLPDVCKFALRNTNSTLPKVCWTNQSWPNMHERKAAKYVEKMRRSYRLSQTPPTGNTRNPPTCLWQHIRSVNPAWASSPSALPSLKQKSENYNTGLFRIHGKLYITI